MTKKLEENRQNKPIPSVLIKGEEKRKYSVEEIIALFGLEKGLRLWAKKMYSTHEPKTAMEWASELKERRAIEEVPDIVKKL